MKNYEVIIVGCGPAGIAAAKILSENNINLFLIEKNKFPRQKLCGGGLTNKSLKLLKQLNLNIDKISSKRIKSVKIVAKSIQKEIELNNDIVMIERLEFDYNNFKQINCENKFENENVISIENNVLITDKNKYQFKYIIFADGVNGYSRSLIKNRKFGFCVEYNSKKNNK